MRDTYSTHADIKARMMDNKFIDWERLYLSEKAKNQVLEDILLKAGLALKKAKSMPYEINIIDNASPVLEKIVSLLDAIKG